MTRRDFLGGGVALATAQAFADGDDVSVSNPGVPERSVPVVPAGAGGFGAFRLKCIGCQLCVKACPEKVLRLSDRLDRFPLPVMGFEHGYCRPACTRCADVCPSGAIARLSEEEKLRTPIGRATWHKERCIAAKEAIALVDGIPVLDSAKCIGCGACENLCPARPLPAITVDGI